MLGLRIDSLVEFNLNTNNGCDRGAECKINGLILETHLHELVKLISFWFPYLSGNFLSPLAFLTVYNF